MLSPDFRPSAFILSDVEALERRLRERLAAIRVEEVRPERDLKAAFLLLRRHAYTLVLVSHRPPALDALEFLKRLRRQSSSFSQRSFIIPIVGGSSRQSRRPWIDAGASAISFGVPSAGALATWLGTARHEPRRFIEVLGYAGPDRRTNQPFLRWPERRQGTVIINGKPSRSRALTAI